MRFVIREQDVVSYSPANHSDTSNLRIIGAETVGAKYLEVISATLGPGATASPHRHPGIEQVVHIIEGAAEGQIDGHPIKASAGDWIFIPEGMHHTFRATGTAPMRLILIYAPPYNESFVERER